jgi:para-aminobenzoate synthetase component 1
LAFGYLSYDLKNDVESLQSNNFDGLHFADLFFFQPKKFFIKRKRAEIQYLTMCEEDDEDLDEINLQSEDHESKVVSVEIKQRISKNLDKVSKMLYHIQQGFV